MKELEALSIDKDVLSRVATSRDKLRAFAGIKVDILETSETTIRIRVEQVELKNNFLLNQSQLVSRAGSIFTPLGRKFKLHFVPVVYSPDFEIVTGEWIEDKMDELGLKRSDVIRQLGIDKVTLSRMITGIQNLSRFNKAAFYYYFLTYEINRDVRAAMDKKDEDEAEDSFVLPIVGMFDGSMAVVITDKLREISKSYKKIKIDLAECTYISSSGIGTLITATEMFKEQKIINCPPKIKNVFDVLGIDLLLKVE